MLPSLALLPGGMLEWLLLMALALTSAGVAAISGKLPERALGRFAALIAIYLCAALALALLAHAWLGTAPWIVSSYALMLMISVLLAWSVAVPRLLATGVPLRLAFYMIAGCLLFGVIGSRLASALSELPHLSASHGFVAHLMDRNRAGLGMFGAFALDSVFLVVLFGRFPQCSLARSLDASASAIALNVAVGRIGCLFAGCCFGAITNPGPLSLSAQLFQPGSPAGAAYAHTADVSIWATQPLESAGAFAIALACEALHRARARLQLRDGTVIAVAAGSYGALRTSLELVRADSPRTIAGVLTIWQGLALLLFLGAIAWLGMNEASRRAPSRHDG